MRSKVKKYLVVSLLFVVATSGTLLWNSSAYIENFRIMALEQERHSSYHHLVMNLETSLMELYRYEAGYSPDLDALVASVEEVEEDLDSLAKRETDRNLVEMIGALAEDFRDYKASVSQTVTISRESEKEKAVHEAARIGKKIAGVLAAAEEMSEKRLDEINALNAAKVRTSQRVVAVTVVLVFFFALVVYLHIRTTVLRPFIKLINFVEKVSEEGDFNSRTEVPADHDLALLARRFNEMMENLGRWDEELKCNYEELKVSNEELQNSYTNLEELTTELEEKSQELSDAGEDLKSIDRLKNEFMQNVSHELRTPLTPVAGYLELFLNKDLGNLSPTQLEIMTDMHQCCKRLAFIIDSLLEMVSLQEDYPTEKFELFDVADIVKELGEQSAMEAKEKGLSLKVDCPENLPSINGAKKKIILMLNHILKNAVKFTHEGGDVTFTVNQLEEGAIEFTIRDSGIGISEEKINKIFEPFLQLDSSLTRGYEGVGLGLALVKKVAEIHRGRINVLSKEEEGTTFIVSLPSA